MTRTVEQYEVMPLEGEKATYLIWCPSCDCRLGGWKTPTGQNTRKCGSCGIRWKLDRDTDKATVERVKR